MRFYLLAAILLPVCCCICSTLMAQAASRESLPPFLLRVVDDENDWPVPLVKLTTTNHLQWVTDNAGLIAIDDPSLQGQDLFLELDGDGYELPPDGFGFRGVRVTPQPGLSVTVRVDRRIVAKRLGRLTGSGLFCYQQKALLAGDSVSGSLLPPGWEDESGIVGCDSIQTASHLGRQYWFWGDSAVARYPLGIFDASGAVTAIQPLSQMQPPLFVPFEYFRSEDGWPRAVAAMRGDGASNDEASVDGPRGDGPTWLTGVASIASSQSVQHPAAAELVASYQKISPPLDVVSVGLCRWDPLTEQFQHWKTVWEKTPQQPDPPLYPEGHAVPWTDESGQAWLLFGDPFPTLRCRADWEHWQSPDQWQQLSPPPHAVTPDGQAIVPHRGSIAWSGYRKRWVAIFTQHFGDPSPFGEIWFAEAESPFGPWQGAVKVLSHQRHTFYNPRIRWEMTAVDSPILLFEGTYTTQFSNGAVATPRYEYNQLLYRLDLDDDRLPGVATDAANK